MLTLNQTDQSIVFILNYLQGMKNKNYCYPCQKKILEILDKKYGVQICLRTLNYHLANLEKEEYIYRQRRDPLKPNGLLIYQTTLYKLAKKAFSFLANLSLSLKRGYFKVKQFFKPKYISSRKELAEEQTFLSREESLIRVRELKNKLKF